MKYRHNKTLFKVLLPAILLLLLSVIQAYADLGVSMSRDDSDPSYDEQIYPGDITAFRITLQNSNDASAITDVVFTNTMPIELMVAGSGLVSYTCTDGDGNPASTTGTVTAVVGSNEILLIDSDGGNPSDGNGGTVPMAAAGSGQCDIIVEVTSIVQNASHANIIGAGDVTGLDNTGVVGNPDPAQQSITVLTLNNPSISKEFKKNSIVEVDEIVTLTLTIDNTSNSGRDLPLNGAVDSPTYGLQDDLPDDLVVATDPNQVISCSQGSTTAVFSPSTGDNILTIVGGSIPAGASCDFSVDLVGTTAGTGYVQSLDNTIDRNNDFHNKRGLTPGSNATDSLNVHSALQVDKRFNSNTIRNGQQDTLTITLHNDSTLTSLTQVTLTENNIKTSSNAGVLTIDNISLSGCGGGSVGTINSVGFELTSATIVPNSDCVVTITFTPALDDVSVSESFTDEILEGAVGNLGGVISQEASDSINVIGELTVSKSRSPSQVAPGNPARFQVTVNNYSGGLLSDVRITDALPGGMLALDTPEPSMSGSGCSGSLVSNIAGPTPSTIVPTFTFDMTVGSGVNSSQCVVTFYAMLPVVASVGTNFNNSIAAGGVCDGNGTGSVCNQRASGNARVTARNPVTVSKSFSPNSGAEGTVSELTIVFENFSAQAATLASITDNLPLGTNGLQLVVADPPLASTSCLPVTATLTANEGDDYVSLENFTIPPRATVDLGSAAGTCEMSVKVVGGAGIYTNSLPVAALSATQTFRDSSTDTAESPGPVQSTLTYSSSLDATKSFSPTTIVVGGMSTVAVRLFNNGGTTLNNVSLTDPLPAGMTIANPANSYTTCGGVTSISASAGNSSASLSGAVIPSNSQCEFLFDVVASSGAGPWVNTIPAGNITADGGVQNISAVSSTLNVSSGYGIVITNNTSPNSLSSPGQTSVLTLNLFNSGSENLTGLSLTDYFTDDGTSGGALTGMLTAATPDITTTCSGGIVSAAPNASEFSLSSVSLDVGESCIVTVNVTMRQVGTIQDVIPVGAITTNQGASNTLEASTSLSTQASIGVTKRFEPTVVEPGERARLIITLINPLALPVANLSFTDDLPAGMTIPAGANPLTDCSGGSLASSTITAVILLGGNLPAASGGIATTCEVSIDVVTNAQGTYINVVEANSVTGSVGGSPVDNPSPATAELEVRTPATIGKSFDPSSVSPGTPSTLTITINNPTNIDFTGVALIDTLPENLVVALTPNVSTDCGGVVSANASGTWLSIAGGTVPASSSCQIEVDTLSNNSGVYTNIIAGQSLVTTEGVTNEEPAEGELRVSEPPVISKQFNPPAIAAGGTSTLTIFIENNNPVALTTNSHFDDVFPDIPGDIEVASPLNVSTDCTGTFEPLVGDTTIRLESGAIIPVGGCSINVDVTGSSPGAHINIIPSSALTTDLGNNLQPAMAELEISVLGYISGRVFQDNGITTNGTYESGIDFPLEGVTINLQNGGGVIIGTSITDSLGNYSFIELPAGTYSVVQPIQPTGTVNSITTAGTVVGVGGGTVGTPTNIVTIPSAVSSIVLNGTIQIDGSPDNNFSEIVTSSISGTVFLDENNNGEMNGSDTPIASETIELLDSGESVIDTTTTDGNGNYTFSDLPPGTYSIRQPNQPSGTSNGITSPGVVDNGGTVGTATLLTVLPSRISNIVLPPNTEAANNNFAEIPNTRRISGFVFLDYGNDGTIDGSDHGIGSQTVNLTGTDANSNPVSLTTTTASDGTFSFTDLPEGTYTLDQPAQPTGTTNGTVTAGSAGGTATNPTTTPSQIANIDLTGENSVSGDNVFAEIPGPAVDLALSKTHSPASFGEGSTTGFYSLTPSNVGTLDTTGEITVVDTLPIGITASSFPSSDDWNCGGAGQVITCTTSTVITAGGTGSDIVLPVTVASGLAGQLLVNNAVISGGDEPPGFDGNNSDSDPTPIAQSATVAGHVWRDTDHDRNLDPSEEIVPGWDVELLLNGTLVATTTTDGAGGYSFTGVAPGSGYQIRFFEPSSSTVYGYPVPNEDGTTFTNGAISSSNPAGADNSAGTLQGLTLVGGTSTTGQSLPLDPSGVVYDSITRLPVTGAVVTISGPGGFNPSTHLIGGAANVSQTTTSSGYYQYLLLTGAPAGTYIISVTPPPGYLPTASTFIPVCENNPTVGNSPDPALVQTSANPPLSGVSLHDSAACPTASSGFAGGSSSTQYYTSFIIDPNTSANVVNNHFPVDPVLEGAVTLIKTSPLVNVSIGQLVPYTITAVNTLSANLGNINIIDTVPPGFKYVAGSASIDGVRVEPTRQGRQLTWADLSIADSSTLIIKMLLVVGTGVQPGDYVNSAQAFNNLVTPPDNAVSNRATATVRVVPDPVFDCSDLIGKVFDDQNGDGYQNEGEPPIPNVRLATVRGLLVTTDAQGRYHVTCAMIPENLRGSNFIMKLDERTLPSGYRITTENPRTVRLTRGKMSKLNFGATIHRVVRLEMTDEAFIQDSLDPSEELTKGLENLIFQLHEKPSVIRLAYNKGEGEDKLESLIRKQLKTVRKSIESMWDEQGCCYTLVFEEEVFQRHLQGNGGVK